MVGRDPREVGLDPGEEFDLVSDGEDTPMHNSKEDLAAQLAAMEKEEQDLLRKQEEIRKKKELLLKQSQSTGRVKAEQQVSRTPSPRKPLMNIMQPSEQEIKPRNLAQRLHQASQGGSATSVSTSSSEPITTSYFLQKLEESQTKKETEKQQRHELMQSRVFTFDSILEINPVAVDEKELYSGQQISRRYVDPASLKKFLLDKKVLRLPKLFAKVCPPDFPEPQYPNWVVVGIMTKKTEPKPTSDGRSKFVVFVLSDFRFSIRVTMFGAAVEKYNKLRIGDVIALLNPDIYVRMEAAGHVSGDGFRTFSLSIKHAGDSVLEIGKSKYFGRCASRKKDGTLCGEPINTETEECCTYHKELRVRKTAGKRLEFQTSVRPVSPTRNGKKQEMLLGKPDNRGGWLSSRVVTNETALNVDGITKLAKHFSTTNKHHAFFNSEITDTHDMKKKALVQTEYRKQVKNMELAKSLDEQLARSKRTNVGEKDVVGKVSAPMKAVAKVPEKTNDTTKTKTVDEVVPNGKDVLKESTKASAVTITTKDADNADKEEKPEKDPKKYVISADPTLEERRALLRYAYGAKGLMQLGFDPTARGSSKGILSVRGEEEKRKASAKAEELSKLAKKRKVDLSTAPEVLELRRKQMREADEMIKRFRKDKDKVKNMIKAKQDQERKVNAEKEAKRKKKEADAAPGAFMRDDDVSCKAAPGMFELSDSSSDDDELVEVEPADPSAFKKFKEQMEVKREASVS